MDDRQRDKFYTPPNVNPPDDDGDEYELEAPDEAIEERRRQDAMASVERRIDINEVYADAERSRGSEILENWVRNFRFQFQVKHLLIATAVLAIVLTLFKLHVFLPVLFVLIMLSIIGVTLYLRREDLKHQKEAAERREQIYAERRQKFGPGGTGSAVQTPVAPLPEMPPLQNEVDEMWQVAANEERRFHFNFSLKEMMLAMTAAAVALGLLHIFGGPAAATLLGLVALGGLFVFALGYDPPQAVVLGWWLTLILYIAVSLFAAVW
jgi:hypothetical protein